MADEEFKFAKGFALLYTRFTGYKGGVPEMLAHYKDIAEKGSTQWRDIRKDLLDTARLQTDRRGLGIEVHNVASDFDPKLPQIFDPDEEYESWVGRGKQLLKEWISIAVHCDIKSSSRYCFDTEEKNWTISHKLHTITMPLIAKPQLGILPVGEVLSKDFIMALGSPDKVLIKTL